MDDTIRPDYYVGTDLECIDVMQLCFGNKAVINYCMINAFKYIWRGYRKGGQQDLIKAKTYLSFIKERGWTLSPEEAEQWFHLSEMIAVLEKKYAERED